MFFFRREKNLAYGRHQLSQSMQIEAPIPKKYGKKFFDKQYFPFLKLCNNMIINEKKKIRTDPFLDNFVIRGQN